MFQVITICLLLFTSLSVGQITLTAQNFAGIGTVFTSYQTNGAQTVDIGSSGANQSWTIPIYAWQDPIVVRVVAPNSTPYSANFPTATTVSHSQQGSDESFFYSQLSETGFYGLGVAGSADGEEMIDIYESAALQFPLPLSFGHDSWLTLSRYTYEILPGYDATVVDSSLSSIDGWGTITTSAGTFQSLRIFRHNYVRFTTSFGSDTEDYFSYTWIVSTGIAIASIASLASETNPVFTTGSVFINLRGDQTDADNYIPSVQAFKLSQNYPNPFNPQTEILFSLPKAGRINLRVYDLLGREIATLFNGQTEAGEHQVKFNGADLPSGVYVYRLTSEDFSESRKMMLMK